MMKSLPPCNTWICDHEGIGTGAFFTALRIIRFRLHVWGHLTLTWCQGLTRKLGNSVLYETAMKRLLFQRHFHCGFV